MSAPTHKRAEEARATYKTRPTPKVAHSLSFPQARHLTRKERVALEAYKNYLLEKLPNQIERIVLFGSKARGDGTPDSDVDLLIVINGERILSKLQDPRWATIVHGTEALDFEYGLYITPIVRHVSEVKDWTPLLDHVHKEGVELWHRPTTKPEPWPEGGERAVVVGKDNHIDARMAIARDKLAAASALLAQHFYNDCISKAYYAMFYASKALLLALDEDPNKHEGVVSLFGERIAKVGLSDPNYGTVLRNAKELREEADYGDFFRATKEQAEQAFENAQDFVKEAEKTLAKIRARGESNVH